MTKFVVLDKEGQIIGRVSAVDEIHDEAFFTMSIAHAFGVYSSQVVRAEKYNKDGIYLCVVCRENPVDTLNGYDTCFDCVSKI